MPCDRFYGCSVNARTQGLVAAIAPYNVSNVLDPPWPWLWTVRRSAAIPDGSSVFPPVCLIRSFTKALDFRSD